MKLLIVSTRIVYYSSGNSLKLARVPSFLGSIVQRLGHMTVNHSIGVQVPVDPFRKYFFRNENLFPTLRVI